MCLFNVGSGIESGGDYLWLNELHVVENRRGRGLGRTLLEHVKAWAREHSCERIYSCTSHGNEALKRDFERAGFRGTDLRFYELGLDFSKGHKGRKR